MDTLDRDLIALLRTDGRAPVASLAAGLGVSRATVKARLDRLVEGGVIQGFTVVLNAPGAAGRRAERRWRAGGRGAGDHDHRGGVALGGGGGEPGGGPSGERGVGRSRTDPKGGGVGFRASTKLTAAATPPPPASAPSSAFL